MPAAVWTKRDELLQQRAPVVETGDAAHREQPSRPGLVDRASEDRRVQDDVDRVHHLREHSFSARRLWIAKGEPDQPRQGFARAVGVQRAQRARMPGIFLRCTDYRPSQLPALGLAPPPAAPLRLNLPPAGAIIKDP